MSLGSRSSIGVSIATPRRAPGVALVAALHDHDAAVLVDVRDGLAVGDQEPPVVELDHVAEERAFAALGRRDDDRVGRCSGFWLGRGSGGRGGGQGRGRGEQRGAGATEQTTHENHSQSGTAEFGGRPESYLERHFMSIDAAVDMERCSRWTVSLHAWITLGVGMDRRRMGTLAALTALAALLLPTAASGQPPADTGVPQDANLVANGGFDVGDRVGHPTAGVSRAPSRPPTSSTSPPTAPPARARWSSTSRRATRSPSPATGWSPRPAPRTR